MILLTAAFAAGIDGLPGFVGPGPGAPPEIVQPAGDLDGDGLGDFIVAVPLDDTNGNEAGAVYFLYADAVPLLDGGTPISALATRLLGEEPQDQAGRDVAALGDTDGDGFPDVAIAAPEASWDQVAAGKVYVVFGGSERVEDGNLDDIPTIHGVKSDARVGSRVFGAPDLDGDGLDELMIGVSWSNPAGDPSAGWLGVLFGRPQRWPDDTRVDLEIVVGAVSTTMDAAFLLNQPASYAGLSATVVEDQTGDGLRDLFVGAPGYDAELDTVSSSIPTGNAVPGAGFLFASRTREELQLDPVQTEEHTLGVVAGNELTSGFPWIVTALPDGRLATSAFEADFGTGSVLVFDTLDGEHVEADAVERWDGERVGDLLGYGLANAYGLDGALLLAGAPGWDGGRGRVVFLGDSDIVLEGCAPGDEAGYSVRSHLGPDPSGEDRPYAGIAAPGAGFWEGEAGHGYVLTVAERQDLPDECRSDEIPEIDADGDGWMEGEDCDDAVAWRFPGALEVCGDDVDDDCDGEADEACAPPPRCGCAAGPGAEWGVLIGLLALRRRR